MSRCPELTSKGQSHERPKGSCHQNKAAHAKRLLSHHLAERHSKALRSVDEPTEDVDDQKASDKAGAALNVSGKSVDMAAKVIAKAVPVSHSAENLRLFCCELFRRYQTCVKHRLEFLERGQRVISWAGWSGCRWRYESVLYNNPTSSSS